MNKALSTLTCAALMIAALFTSCSEAAKAEQQTTAATAADTTEAIAEEKYPYELDDLEGTDITYLCCEDDLWGGTTQIIDYEQMTGDSVTDAIYTKNRKAETELNFKLITVKAGIFDLASMCNTAVLAADPVYDAAYAQLGAFGSFQTNAVNLLGVSTLHFDDEWWEQSFIKYMTMQKSVLKTVIDYTNMQTQLFCGSVFFNKDLAESNNLNGIYDSVFSGEWTYDKINEFMSVVVNLNGDSSFAASADGSCIYGISAFHNETPLILTQGSGQLLVTKDEDGSPAVISDYSKFVDVYDKLSSILSKDGYCLLLNTSELTGGNIFWAGRGLFLPDSLNGATSSVARTSEIEYGVLPMPKYNEEQETYLTPTSQYATSYLIPLSAADPEMSGMAADYLNYLGYNSVLPELMTTLTYKGLRDEDSIKTLEIILNNHITDIGHLCGWTSSLLDTLMTQMVSGKNTAVSNIEKSLSGIQKKIDAFNAQ